MIWNELPFILAILIAILVIRSASEFSSRRIRLSFH
ncbi:hypothetical protein V6Z12_A13G068400 [Gossypium hirsutum]